MRSLRWRLFAGILGAALAAVVVSLAIGVVLTRGAVREQIADEVAGQADLVSAQARLAFRARGAAIDLLAPAPAPGFDGGPPPVGAGPAIRLAPHGIGPDEHPRPRLLTLDQARGSLPAEAFADLDEQGRVDGRGEIGGEEQIFSARRVRDVVVIAARPAAISSDDFSDYLGGLLLAGSLAAALAALAAALLARRLSAPIARVGDAARSLAAGQDPGRLPPERTTELATLSDSFNEMSEQLARSREAERAVLLSVSHELRTPLTAIAGYAEALDDGTVEPRAAAAVVGREAERLARLVGDLLALAKIEQGLLEVRAEDVDLGEIAREAERRLRPQATAQRVEVRTEAAGSASAHADSDRLLQVISNLLENAIRVTPEGGRVTVRARAGEVTVSDTGPGIPTEDLEHAFDRFHLRRRHGRGSPDGAGLGLAIVRDLTEAMGGSVSLHSVPGEGATFTVRLPVG
jgi:signal transduction histidine kinase